MNYFGWNEEDVIDIFQETLEEMNQLKTSKYKHYPQVYSEHELIYQYVANSLKKGHLLTKREIDNNPDMASYQVYYDRFGGLSRVNKMMVNFFGMKLNLTGNGLADNFCTDCKYNPLTCNRNVEECMADGSLYVENYY